MRSRFIIGAGTGLVTLSSLLLLAPLAAPADESATSAAPDLARIEPGEPLPGGGATSRKPFDDRDAFSHPSGNLPIERDIDFRLGNGVFRKEWRAAPAGPERSDGLGPLFNAPTCQRCHIRDGRGHPPVANWPRDSATSMLLRLSVPPRTAAERARLAAREINALPDPVYGGQLQDRAIEGHEPEGRIHIEYEPLPVTLGDGAVVELRKPRYTISHLAYGPPDPGIMLSPRIAPQMIGLGLLEAVPETAILAWADPEDGNGDGISGRPNRVWSKTLHRVVLGRFGWKAGSPDIRQQSAEAFSADIGISTTLLPDPGGDCTARQEACREAPAGSDPGAGGGEAGELFLDLVAFYSRNLAVPPRRTPDAPDILRGKALFHAIGCAACHRPSLRTDVADGQPHLSDQLIWPYTDLLLHDMGPGLADDRPEGAANGREWRTPPLWGIGLTPRVNGHSFYLHDGRAHDLLEAVLWHGGEAQAARDAFAALAREDRDRLIAFVKSL